MQHDRVRPNPGALPAATGPSGGNAFAAEDGESEEDLGFALVDHARTARAGFPEVVYGDGKSPQQIAEIAEAVLGRSGVVLATRIDEGTFVEISRRIPDAQYNGLARLTWADRRPPLDLAPGVVVASAGTSDLAVSEEAVVTARLMGCEVSQLKDVGVAGLHRLVKRLPALREARVVVAVAGMEGALPSVVAGLISAPVIAVPTSVGYGASYGGIAALLAMLNSCAPGVAVVNIDNGFGAGYMAATIARMGFDGDGSGSPNP